MNPQSLIAADTDTIDAAALTELHEIDGDGPPTVFLELVELFKESTPQLLSQACQALHDSTQLTMIAHTLKGSCSNFGAASMGALCLELETLGRDGKTEGARQLIDVIEQEYFKVRAALAEHSAGL